MNSNKLKTTSYEETALQMLKNSNFSLHVLTVNESDGLECTTPAVPHNSPVKNTRYSEVPNENDEMEHDDLVSLPEEPTDRLNTKEEKKTSIVHNKCRKKAVKRLTKDGGYQALFRALQRLADTKDEEFVSSLLKLNMK